MMTKHTLALAFALFALAPASAQDPADTAVEGVVDAAADASEDAAIEAAAEAMEEAAEEWTGEVYSTEPFPIDYASFNPRPSDYPTASWLAEEEGGVFYALDVDAEGNVTDCSIVESSGYPALDAKTCEILLERAEFEPAYDENGQAIASAYSSSMDWRREQPDFSGPSKVHVAFTLTAEGQTTDCDVIEVSGNISARMRDTMEREPCPGVNRGGQAPFRDENGNPISRRVELQIIVDTSDVSQ